MIKSEEKVDKGTIVRTIALVITWVNMLLSKYGLEPIPVVGEDVIAEALAGAATIWAWFYNNYVTATGKQQKHELKKAGLTKAK